MVNQSREEPGTFQAKLNTCKIGSQQMSISVDIHGYNNAVVCINTLTKEKFAIYTYFSLNLPSG